MGHYGGKVLCYFNKFGWFLGAFLGAFDKYVEILLYIWELFHRLDLDAFGSLRTLQCIRTLLLSYQKQLFDNISNFSP